MPTTLTPDTATLDELGRANIKRVLVGRRLEFFGADPGTRERLVSRCGGDDAGGVMFLCFPNQARLVKSDGQTGPVPPPGPLFLYPGRWDSLPPLLRLTLETPEIWSQNSLLNISRNTVHPPCVLPTGLLLWA